MYIETMDDARAFLNRKELLTANVMLLCNRDFAPTLLLSTDKKSEPIAIWNNLQRRGLRTVRAWYSKPPFDQNDHGNLQRRYQIIEVRFYELQDPPQFYAIRDVVFTPESPDFQYEVGGDGAVRSISFKAREVRFYLKPYHPESSLPLPARDVIVRDRIAEVSFDLTSGKLSLQ